VFTSIDQKKQKGEIPSEIRKDLIDRILNDKICICQREILPGSEPYKQILIWKNKVVDAELESSTLDMWRYLGSIISHKDDYSSAVDVV
jgi:DNA sulfur modification protein DndD